MAEPVKLVLSSDELVAIRSALREVLELLEDPEFETRMGRTRAEITALHRRLSQSQVG